MPPVANSMSRGSPNSGHILVDGVEYDVSNLLSMQSVLDKDRSTVPNYPYVEPSPWQPETRKRTDREQPRTTSTLHTSSPSKKVLPRTNSRRGHHKSHSFTCSPTKKPKGDLRNYLTLQQRFDSSLRALQKRPPQTSSSNNSVPPPPPPPMEDDAHNFEQNWTSPLDGDYERKKQVIEDPFRDSPYISRSMRKSINAFPSSSKGARSSSTSPSLKTAPALQVEISPGFYQPLVGAADTMQAVSDGRVQSSGCMACRARFSCVLEALYVVCPHCKTVSHTDAEYGEGVGLGFQLEDL
jgi:hypothetical protein